MMLEWRFLSVVQVPQVWKLGSLPDYSEPSDEAQHMPSTHPEGVLLGDMCWKQAWQSIGGPPLGCRPD
jgi:hypothetical protein